jgi:hypothetical protein
LTLITLNLSVVPGRKNMEGHCSLWHNRCIMSAMGLFFTINCISIRLLLPVVLYWRETRSLTSRKQHRLRMSENTVLGGGLEKTAWWGAP